jgi:hypothetical protein
MKKVLFAATILLVLSCFVHAQQSTINLHGLIRDQATQEPIPYASISIINSTRGTAANAKGEFDLMIKQSDAGASLKISSIGFLSRTIALDSIQNTASFVIELQADIKLLKEIEVSQSRINPVEIIKAAIDSAGKNYRNEPFNLEFYSEISATNILTHQAFKVESIIVGYYQGYATAIDKRFEIVKKRASGDNPLQATDYPFWPTLEIHRADLIADPSKTGILNEKNIDKFEYNYAGVVMYDEDTLYQIEYVAPKPTQKITGYGVVPKVYKGTIYITTSSNAIVKHEIETDQFSYSIIYKKIKSNYFPYILRGERRLMGENLFSTVSNIVRLTNIELDNVKVIDYKTNEFQNLSQLPDDKEYWDVNYPVENK